MLRAFGSRRNASTGAPPAWEIRMERRRRVDPGVAPTYVGDERLFTRSDAEIRRRHAGIHSPSASVQRRDPPLQRRCTLPMRRIS